MMDELKNARSLVKGSGFALASNLINGAIGFVTSLLIAKTLGTAEYGNFSLTLAVFGMFMAAGSLGIGQATARYIGEFMGRGRQNAAAGALVESSKMSLALFSVFAIALYLLSGPISAFFAKDVGSLLRIMAPAVLLGGMMSFLLSSMQGFQLFGSYSSTEVAHNAVKLAAIALLLWAGFGASGALSGIVFAYAATVLIGFLLLARHVRITERVRAIAPSAIIRMGVPLAAAGYLTFLTTRGSTYLLGAFASSAEVGAYSAALIFGYEFFVLSDALNASFFPVFSAVHSGGKGSFSSFFSHTLRFGAMAVFPVVAYVGIFAPQMVGLFLGADYSRSAGALRILLVLGLAYFLYSTCLSALVAMGRAKKVLALATVPLAAVFIAGSFLIPRLGVNGAAATDSLAIVFAAAASVLTLERAGKVSFPLREVAKAALSAGGMAVFLFYASAYVTSITLGIVVSIASVVVYLALLLAFGAFRKSDAELVEKIFIGSIVYPLVRQLCVVMHALAGK